MHADTPALTNRPHSTLRSYVLEAKCELLRLMREPAQAAGLTALQLVLETGFDAFTSMGKPDGFLNDVQAREADWIGSFFAADLPAITARLAGALQSGQPSPS